MESRRREENLILFSSRLRDSGVFVMCMDDRTMKKYGLDIPGKSMIIK
jgi:hypothetical protein